VLSRRAALVGIAGTAGFAAGMQAPLASLAPQSYFERLYGSEHAALAASATAALEEDIRAGKLPEHATRSVTCPICDYRITVQSASLPASEKDGLPEIV
jgi:hypothetical protein